MNAPSDLVAIPPLYRTVIYYVLALALVTVGALTGAKVLDPLWLTILSGVGGVFFGVSGSNVLVRPDKAGYWGGVDLPPGEKDEAPDLYNGDSKNPATYHGEGV